MINILTIAMIVFLTFETANIVLLYFFPGSKKGNAMGVFNAWEESKKMPAVHKLLRYLVYWVAGTKLIFAGLLVVIIVTGSRLTQVTATGILILSIATFYWKLYPLVRGFDRNKQMATPGYSRTLAIMIGVFIIGFIVVLAIDLVMNGLPW
jgi:hypothetical protein